MNNQDTTVERSPFPLQGVIGIITQSEKEIDQTISRNLQCVEVRADLLLENGQSLQQLLNLVTHARQRDLAVLFTLRHSDQGGSGQFTEQERININKQALDAGAHIIDLEWGTTAATEMSGSGAPMILSHHDFTAMPSPDALKKLTDSMSSHNPLAIKIVPTATNLDDAVRMLEWVAHPDPIDTSIRRIGFAMGASGVCSRILTVACGSPVTYASFGKPTAPGQITLESMQDVYRIMEHNQQTRVVAVVGNSTFTDENVKHLNQEFASQGSSLVAIGFDVAERNLMDKHRELLRIDATVPEAEVE